MLTIIWDVDDVLNDLMRVWFERCWLPEHPDCGLTYHDLHENPPHHLLQISLDSYLASLDSFRLSGAFERLQPVPEVQAWFQQYGHCFRNVVLTAAPLRAAPVSAAWVLRHFGPWVRSFNFVPSPRPGEDIPAYDLTKADYLQRYGQADILIDDNPAHIEAGRKLGLYSILIPRPWNNGCQTITAALQPLVEQAQAVSTLLLK